MSTNQQEVSKSKCSKIILTILLLINVITAGSVICLFKRFDHNNQIISDRLDHIAALHENKLNQLSFSEEIDQKMNKLFNDLYSRWNGSMFDIFDRDVIGSSLGVRDIFKHKSRLQDASINTTQDEYIIKVTIAGFSKDQVKVEIKDNMLTISAENKKQSEDNSQQSSMDVSFNQSILLPRDANIDAIKSSMENGVLNINIPRVKKEVEVKQISVE